MFPKLPRPVIVYHGSSLTDKEHDVYSDLDILFSFANLLTPSKLKVFLRSCYRRVFVDSSILVKNRPPLQTYIDFLLEHKERITTYACYDVPGQPEETLKNLIAMERAGLNETLPIYRIGEPRAYLHLYCMLYSYVGIGGMLAQTDGVNLIEIQKIRKLYPDINLHGFGCTEYALAKYFDSVDSSSAVQMRRFPENCYRALDIMSPEQRLTICLEYVERTSRDWSYPTTRKKGDTIAKIGKILNLSRELIKLLDKDQQKNFAECLEILKEKRNEIKEKEVKEVESQIKLPGIA